MVLFLFISSCGLPLQMKVDPPRVVSVNGNIVVFEINKSYGFVLYYRVYPQGQDPERDLSNSGFSREADIFRSFRYFKSYPSNTNTNTLEQSRFIWQPLSDQLGPYIITLDVSTGSMKIQNDFGILYEEDRLIRVNLQSFEAFRIGDTDLADNFSGNTGQLAWAAMNMELDAQTLTLQNSEPIYLHEATSISIS